MLLPGCDVGDCAIVGAGAVVRGKVDPYAIVIGNPSRQIGDTMDFARKHLQRAGLDLDDLHGNKQS